MTPFLDSLLINDPDYRGGPQTKLYNGMALKPPGEWGFFPPIFVDASLNQNPTLSFIISFVCYFKVKMLKFN